MSKRLLNILHHLIILTKLYLFYQQKVVLFILLFLLLLLVATFGIGSASTSLVLYYGNGIVKKLMKSMRRNLTNLA